MNDFTKDVSDWYAEMARDILMDPGLQPLHFLFDVPRERLADFNTCMQMQSTAVDMVTGALHDDLRNRLSAVIGRMVRRRYRTPSTLTPDVAEAATTISDTMGQRGWSPVPDLSPTKTAEILHWLDEHDDRVVISDDRQQAPQYVTMDEARARSNMGRYPWSVLVDCPHIMEVALDPIVLGAVERQFAAIPTILSIDAWRSFGGVAEAREAQNFHIDLDDFRFCKQFLYLTDVDTDSGPHTIMPGSHRLDAIRALRDHHPDGPDAFEDWYLRRLRKTDEDVVAYLKAEPDYLTGPAGSRMLIDTMSVHKGQKPKHHDRVVLAIEYAVTPLLKEMPDIVTLGSTRAERMAPDILTPPNDYVARFFVQAQDR